jgi:hypothetical protein
VAHADVCVGATPREFFRGFFALSVQPFAKPVVILKTSAVFIGKESDMIWVMDMSTGKIVEDEFGRFEDEVLNAEWLPPQPELALGLQPVHATPHPDVDAEGFLDRVYRGQE